MNQSNQEYLEKVQSIEGIIDALYESMSGEIGEPRDWDLYRFLFHPGAKSIRYDRDLDGEINAQYLSPDDYVNTIGKWMETTRKTGFYERDIYRIIHTFGNISHVWCTSESFHNKSDEKPYVRNIHSYQLLNHNGRYWIMSLYWARETPENPIPDKYLP